MATPKGVLSFLAAPIVFVTGKGGVGKTTTAAGIALAAARAGQRVCLVEFDDAEAGQRALKGADAKVDHVVATYDKALEAALAPLVGGSMIAKAVLRQGAFRAMTRAMPATREFVSLERVRVLSTSYDRVVVDLPASGHALDWLRVPGAFERFLPGSPVGGLGRRLRDEVVAKGRSDVIIVTLAEPMVLSETGQLASRMHRELARSPAMVVVNRVPTQDPAGAEAAAQRLFEASGVAAPQQLARLLKARADVAREAIEALRVTSSLDTAKVIALPEAPADPPVNTVAGWLDWGATR